MHARTLRYRKLCVWNAWGVPSHLPPNTHAENLRQIFILRPVSSLIQSKWMQQQTNLSNPTSKHPCSLSLWLKDTDIAEERSEGGEEEVVVKGKGGIVDSTECMTQTADFRKAPSKEALWLQSWITTNSIWAGRAYYCSSNHVLYTKTFLCSEGKQSTWRARKWMVIIMVHWHYKIKKKERKDSAPILQMSHN